MNVSGYSRKGRNSLSPKQDYCTGVTINHTGPHWARTGPEMTDYFTPTTN